METSNSTTRELLRRYYEGLPERDGWDRLLSNDILLTGAVAKESRGRDAYTNNKFFKMVKGLRVKETVVEGERAFALVNYDLMSPRGKPFSCDVAEFWKVEGERLDSIAIYFDTAAFANFLAQ